MAGDIVIIGGGFAGLEAARVLAKNHKRLAGRRVLLVDAKPTFDFLPVLPDIAGGWMRPTSATLDLSETCERLGVNFAQAQVTRVDTRTQEVFCANGRVLGYEYLLIACGSITNFYGMADVERRSLKCDSVADAGVLYETLCAHPKKRFLIVGGGYTGVELATNLAVFFRRRRVSSYSLNIIERAEDVLGVVPLWMRDYARVNLARLRINVFTDCSLSEVTETRVKLSNGLTFEDYVMIWSAGVRAPDFVKDLPYEKDKQGRVKVDASLRCGPHVFAAGDVAQVMHRGKVLRMAVQFSLAQAVTAGKNILRSIAGSDRLLVYRPTDLGYLVPMANRRACGMILFLRSTGLFAWLMHYAMCWYRSLSWTNRLGMIRDILWRRKI